MGRSPCCSKAGLNRGPWSPEEDVCLAKYIETHGEGCWRAVPKSAGLLRCGKSCRLRWVNYLRPSVRRGNISEDEENLIIKLHSLLGNRWSLIAGRIPGRTDNEIKNYWNTHLSKKLKKMDFDPKTHKSVNMTQKTHCEPRADRRNENRPSPSVFQSQGNSVSESLKETSEHQTDSARISLTCNELLQDSRLTSKESCSVEINLSNTYKIHSSEMVICRPTSPTSDHAVYHRITDRDLSISVNSEHQGEAVQLRPVSEVISTTGDSFTSNCSSPSSSVLYPAGFSRSISNCDSLSSLLTTTSTNCKDQLIISSEPTSALTIEYDKERSALDQTGFLQIFDFSSVDFTEYDTNAGSPARSGTFPQRHISNNYVLKNDIKFSFDIERLNTSMDLADVDQTDFLKEPGVSVAELISESINKQEAEDYSELTMPSTRTDLWDGFGQLISSDDDKPLLNSLNVESCSFSFHYNCDLELETSRQPTILPQYRDGYDDNWYFESCTDFHGDNSMYTYELY